MSGPGVVGHVYDTNMWGMEAGGSDTKGQSCLSGMLEASLGYMRPCLKKIQGKKKDKKIYREK